jgi:hypothetical protein
MAEEKVAEKIVPNDLNGRKLLIRPIFLKIFLKNHDWPNGTIGRKNIFTSKKELKQSSAIIN